MSSAAPSTQRWAFVALLTMTAVWGSTFFLIKDIVTRIPVPDLLAVRFAIVTLALVLITNRRLRMSPGILALGRLSEAGAAVSLSAVQLLVISALCTLAATLPVESSPPGIQLPGTPQDW